MLIFHRPDLVFGRVEQGDDDENIGSFGRVIGALEVCDETGRSREVVAKRSLRREEVDRGLLETATTVGFDWVAALRDEAARMEAGGSHPNLVASLGMRSVRGEPLLLLERMNGPVLDHLVRDRALHWSEAVDYTVQHLHGLRQLHRRGMAHGDNAPHNLFLDGLGGLKLGDFGLATGAGLPDRRLPMKIRWTAPSDHRSADQILTPSAPGDLWRAGVAYLAMLAGTLPRGSVLKNGAVALRTDTIGQVEPIAWLAAITDTLALPARLTEALFELGRQLFLGSNSADEILA